MIDAWGSWIYPGDRTSGDDFMGDLARMGIIFESGGGRPRPLLPYFLVS